MSTSLKSIIVLYYHSIQTSSPLKPLGKLKPNFMGSIYRMGGTSVYINNLAHMTKMAPMPVYGKNPSKIFFSETNGLISTKIGVKHRWLKYYNVYVNHDTVMTLTQFMARSTLLAHAFEWGKLFECHLKGKTSREIGKWTEY